LVEAGAILSLSICHLKPVETGLGIFICNAIVAVSVIIKFKIALGRIALRAVGSLGVCAV